MSATAIRCPVCGGELRVTSMTAEGATFKCGCGKTTLTQLSEGKLDLGIVRDSKLTDPA